MQEPEGSVQEFYFWEPSFEFKAVRVLPNCIQKGDAARL